MADLKQIDYNGTTYNIGGGASKYRHTFRITMSGSSSSANQYNGSVCFSVINSNPPTYYSEITLDKIKSAISDAYVPASGLLHGNVSEWFYLVDAVKWDGTQFVVHASTFAWNGSKIVFYGKSTGIVGNKILNSDIGYNWLGSETIS